MDFLLQSSSISCHPLCKNLPADLKAILRTSSKYNLTLNSPNISLTHKLDMPAWFHPGKDPNTPLHEHGKPSKCLWRTHHVRTVFDLITLDTLNEKPEHNKKSKQCKCPYCTQSQSAGCPHPKLCLKEASIILSDLSPKFDPYDDTNPLSNKIPIDDLKAAETHAIGPPEDVKLFNLKESSSGKIHENLCIFTNPKKR